MIKHLKILTLFFVFTLFGCSLQIGEEISSINITFSAGCLNGINKKIDLYLKGRLTPVEIEQVSHCAKTALTLFKDRVRGSKKGEFTPRELRKFIQDLFLQDQVISSALLTQMVRLKTVVIGGSEDKLTLSDIERFIIFIDVLKKEAVFFQPYIQALNVSDKKKAEQKGERRKEEKFFNKIEEDLKQSISRLSIFIKQFSNPYHLEDMKALVQELGVFFNRPYDPALLDKKIKLVGALKKFIVGGSEQVIQPNEWEGFLIGASQLISLRVNYLFLKKQKFFVSPNGMQYATMMLKDLLKFLSLSVQNHPTHRIGESDFLKIFAHFQQTGIITKKLSKQAVRNIFLILLGKVFNTQKDRYGVIELTAEQLEKIYTSAQPWFGIQSFLDYISREKSFQQNINNFSKMAGFFSSSEFFLKGQKKIQQMLLLKPLYKESPKVYLSNALYTKNKSTMDYKNMTIYNFFHFIAMMMRMGYEKNYPISPGMTDKELSAFFKDFHIIGQNLGLFQKAKSQHPLNPGEPEFIVANTLIPSTKGFDHNWIEEEYLIANEIVEYLAFAFSFGFSVIEIDTDLFKICGKELDESDKHKWDVERYDIACVRLHLTDLLKKYMDNMPDLRKAMAKMSLNQRRDLAEALIEISYETDQKYLNATSLTKGNLKNIVMAVYFVETTINRYDSNKDLVLQSEETRSAFPTFKGYLSRSLVYMHCQESDRLVEAVYVYTVENARLPASNLLSLNERFWSWLQVNTHKWWSWNLYLDRAKLTRVYSAIVKGFLHKKSQQNQGLTQEECFEKELKNIEPYSDKTLSP